MNWAGYVCCGLVLGVAVTYVGFIIYMAKDHL